MGRGNIYYITKKKDADIHFDKTDYYDKLDGLGINHVDNQSEKQSKIPLECLQENMLNLGAITGYGYDNNYFAFSFHFDELIIERAKQNYFKPRLEQLKKQVEALTLSDVVQTAPCLDFIVDDNYGDLITFYNGDSECSISLDDFIRRLEPGVTYYVYEKVILMH